MNRRMRRPAPTRFAYALFMSVFVLTVVAAGMAILDTYMVSAETLPAWALAFAILFSTAAAVARAGNVFLRAGVIGISATVALVATVSVLPVLHSGPHAIAETVYALRGPALIFVAVFAVLALVGEGLWRLANSLIRRG